MTSKRTGDLLTDADAQAALDAMLKAEREKGIKEGMTRAQLVTIAEVQRQARVKALRECLAIADDAECAEHVGAAIRALIEKEEDDA